MRRRKERGEKKISELTSRARRMAGLGPITDLEIQQPRKRMGNYETAKVWAVKAHLANHYRYNQEELDSLAILETKRTNKDEIIYIATEDECDIKDIYFRKAECRSDDMIVKCYFPPKFFDRFSALNKIFSERRAEDNNLKTQLRFGDRDFMILTKEKGSTESYRIADMVDFIGDATIPKIDMSIKWKITSDRPPRRRVASSECEHPASGKDSSSKPTRPVRHHSNRSIDDTNSARKKQKITDPTQVALPSRENSETDMNITQ